MSKKTCRNDEGPQQPSEDNQNTSSYESSSIEGSSGARSHDPDKLKIAPVISAQQRSDQYLVNRSKANRVRKKNTSAAETKKNVLTKIHKPDVCTPDFKDLTAWLNSSSAGNDHPVLTANTKKNYTL